MATNRNNTQGGSMDSMSGSDKNREFESQGKGYGGSSGQGGQQSGSGKHGLGSHSDMEDDEINTAGGREGKFSDSESGSQGQWSPGSGHSSDQ